MRAPLSMWRVLATALVMAAAIAGVVGAPLLMDAYAAWRAAKAAEPRPLVASDAEQGAIARAILDARVFDLFDPPGTASTPRPVERAWVVDRTATLRGCNAGPDEVVFFPHSDASAEHLRDDELYPGLARRWRLELIAANQQAREVPNPGYDDTTWIAADAADSVHTRHQWDALRARRPDVSGFLQLSRAVLAPGRREALVLALHYWPDVFESPSRVVFRLAHDGRRWRVVTQHRAGMPPRHVESAAATR